MQLLYTYSTCSHLRAPATYSIHPDQRAWVGLSGCCAAQVNRLRWRAGKSIGGEATAEGGSQGSYKVRTGARWQRKDSEAFVVDLQPMEIRTFLLTAKTTIAQQPQALRSLAAAA